MLGPIQVSPVFGFLVYPEKETKIDVESAYKMVAEAKT